jgi:S1-C subfamily serine protease
MTRRLRFRYLSRRVFLFLLTALAAGPALGTLRADSFAPPSDDTAALFDKAKGALVRVESGGGDSLLSAGTGFIVDDQGTVLTSSSIIGSSPTARVTVNGVQLDARILGNDPRSGLAMLRVSAPGAPALTLGHSTDLKTGYTVLTLGYPLNLPPAIAQGPVSGFEVHYLKRFFCTTHIHADVPLAPGQVGGPVLNTHGEVVGMIVPSPDDGRSVYALPVEAMEKIMSDFNQYGRARHGWVGVSVIEVPDIDHDGRTVCVLKLEPNTPAARSGIRAGDIVMRIDSREIYRPADVLDASFFSQVGGTMTVVVRREEQLYNYSFAVIERPEAPGAVPVSRATDAAPVRDDPAVAAR